MWVVLIAAVLAVGSMEYADQVDEHANYCENVAAGYWPDYKGIARKECPQTSRGTKSEQGKRGAGSK